MNLSYNVLQKSVYFFVLYMYVFFIMLVFLYMYVSLLCWYIYSCLCFYQIRNNYNLLYVYHSVYNVPKMYICKYINPNTISLRKCLTYSK